ncbi:hypothetical protein QOT17_003471 [Balamuthia mandrillaris]
MTLKTSLLLFFFGMVVGMATAATLQVEPRSSECFHMRVTPNDLSREMEFSFVVSRGGLLDIRVKVTEPDGGILHEELHFFDHHQEDRVTVAGNKEGVYSFCLDNTMSRFTAKVVSFQLGWVDENEVQEYEQQQPAFDAKKLKPIERSVKKIRNTLEQIQSEQKYLRTRASAHRSIQENTFDRVWMFAMLEMAVVISLNAVQIYVMRTWFPNDRRARV